MKFQRIIVGVASLSSLAANAQLRNSRQHFVIPAEQIADAVITSFAARGIHVSADQVKLPAGVLATEANPVLEVSGIQPLGRLSAANPKQTSAGIRLRCKVDSACLPFYAVVSWQGDQDAVIAAKAAAERPAQPAEQPLKLVKAGARLTFIMEADHARIQMEVISLGSAGLGQQVHVTTLDHKHSYVAEVVSPNVVKGAF